MGGLGNQMFQYAIGRSIAIKQHKTLKLDVTAYKTYKLHNGFRLDMLNINADFAQEEEISLLRGSSNFMARTLRRFNFTTNKTHYIEKERTVYDDNVFNFTNIYLDGYWQNEKYFSTIRNSLLKEFTPKQNISKNASHYLKQIQSSQSVSVHVRRGDYLKNPDIGVLDLVYYKKSVRYILQNTENPTFFIFSDDLDWCKKTFNFIPNKIYIENTQTEIEDMTLMKYCQSNIIANSSFSWWAAWLNTNQKKIVIAPKNWMAKNPKNYTWSPSSWIEI